MTLEPEPRPTVLVVDDEPALTAVYDHWLRDDCLVEIAHSGEEALERLSEGPVDVVLLDRHMPDVSGDEVLTTIRNWGLDTRVAMVTGISPRADVLDLGFDDYLVKPVDREVLQDTVARLVDRVSFDSLQLELSSLRVRRNVLETELPPARLEENERYVEVVERIEELERWETEYRSSLGGKQFVTAHEG